MVVRSTPVAPDPRVERAVEALAAAGYNIIVLGWDRGWNLPSQEEQRGYTVVRVRIPASFGRGLRNLPGVLRWQSALLIWLLKNRDRYDIIHACDLDTALPGLLAARIFRKWLVFDIFDNYADAFRVGPLRWLIRWLEMAVFARSDAIIIADDIRQEQFAGIKPRRLAVIYNSPPDLWPDLNAGEESHEFKIAYVGLLDETRGLFTLLDVVAGRPDWMLDLAGFGVDEERVIQRARSLPNVRFHGRVNYATALRLMARASVLIATYDPAVPNHQYASPNKVFEAMMLGKPVVVAKGTHVDELVERYRCGIVVPYGDARSLDSALDQLATSPDLRWILGLAGRRAYETYYHWNLMKARLVALYQELSGPGADSGLPISLNG
ncbi:MAG: glycosyltransferase family 4 protein [Candidatus Methanomethylicaceae archaeon]